MKKLAKIFLILGICFTFYLVYPIILGVYSIKRLNRAKTVDELRSWGLISLFFVSVIGGVLMLCIRQEELDEARDTKIISPTGYSSDYDPSLHLIELKKFFDEGIIDEQTYNEKRKKYMEEL